MLRPVWVSGSAEIIVAGVGRVVCNVGAPFKAEGVPNGCLRRLCNDFSVQEHVLLFYEAIEGFLLHRDIM